MIYFDTSYLAKLYLNEPGTGQVLALVAQAGKQLGCCEHGRLELMTTLKRKQREGGIDQTRLLFLWDKHEQDIKDGLIRYLPITSELILRACTQVASLSPAAFLRSADALHLACAADAGLKQIYSHDRHLLSAAPHFGLRGIDVISAP